MAEIARTDYKDDVLDTSQNTSRKYEIVENSDGTVSLVDRTVYTQLGDEVTAAILNTIFTMLGGFTMVETTQSAYDALPTPRPAKTLYIIKKE